MNPSPRFESRADALKYQFLHKVSHPEKLPRPNSLQEHSSSSYLGMTKSYFCDLFESQLMSRHLDYMARILKTKNESFYTIGSSGHEGNAAISAHLELDDMAFLHYRSGAFVIQRSKKKPGSTPLYDGLLSLVASSEDPIAGGRHKVFGSSPLFIPPQTSTIASHLPKSLGAALSITKTNALSLPSSLSADSIIVCTFGDASLNHSTSQGAINTAQWYAYRQISLPLLFICEDNGIGISVPTPEGWVASTMMSRPHLKYFSCDGLNLLDVSYKSLQAIEWVRTHRRPAFLHIKTVRLLGHAGSDIETSYHSSEMIEQTEAHDPLLYTSAIAIDLGYLTSQDILMMNADIEQRVAAIAEEAITRPKLKTIQDVAASIIPGVHTHLPPMGIPEESQRQLVFQEEWNQLQRPSPMGKLLNWGLHDLLLRYPQTLLFGEDVAKKGGVYNVTNQLQKRFGQERVFDTLLDEQSILGLAIGLAHNGFVPLPEIQFLAYLHNAEDQLRGEAATLSFFSQGQFTNPMVLRIAGLAYQKGFGGHFHNDNSLAVLRDLPGVIVACPSRGDDAVLMMRECVRLAYEERRVVVFVEPIALYMTRDLHQKGDSLWCFSYPSWEQTISFGDVGYYPSSSKEKPTLIITYGNGVPFALQAQKSLESSHALSVMDLRWINPIPTEKILSFAKSFQRILIVDECRQTGSLSEEVSQLLLTQKDKSPSLDVKVLAAANCFIPLGVASTCGLPNNEQIISLIEQW
jgi:2-oxoisovalerate dehydrogenase E1 component